MGALEAVELGKNILMKVPTRRINSIAGYIDNMPISFNFTITDDDVELGAMELFLAAAGLPKYIPIFTREKIDLEVIARKIF